MELINVMKRNVIKIIEWEQAHHDVPKVIKIAVQNEKRSLVQTIKNLQHPPFELDDSVELVSSSFEDHNQGDIGKVVDISWTSDAIGQKEYDIRVRWDNGAQECWIGAENFTRLN